MNTDPTFDGPDEPGAKEGEERSDDVPQDEPIPAAAEPAERVRDVFEREHDRLVHVLVARTGSWAAARDIADEAFANVLEMVQRGSVGNVKAYVYKSALNHAGKMAKAAAYRRSVEHLIDEPSGEHTVPPEVSTQHALRLQRLQDAIRALPNRVRMALVWRFWDDIPYEDIAARLGKYGIEAHERTVKRWIVNALEFCRHEITDGEDGRRKPGDRGGGGLA